MKNIEKLRRALFYIGPVKSRFYPLSKKTESNVSVSFSELKIDYKKETIEGNFRTFGKIDDPETIVYVVFIDGFNRYHVYKEKYNRVFVPSSNTVSVYHDIRVPDENDTESGFQPMLEDWIDEARPVPIG